MDPRRVDVPGYRVLRPLGAGGMGAVYLVEPEGLPGVVRALKVVLVQDAARRARFVREAELLARVDHCPGVVRIHGAGEREGLLWICMEHVGGGDLAQALATRGPLPWAEVVRLGRDVALGLAAVHERGVVHRDLKPANVLLDGRGEPKLVDFGIAQATDLERLTLTGAVMGTPVFLSPEQARGRAIDGRSDVYSLGATLYEVLTGTVPFPDDQGLPALMHAILTAEPEPPSARRVGIPRAVDAALLGALAKDPEHRPDARAFARRLDACLDDPHGAGAPRARTCGGRLALILTLALAPGVALAALAMTIQDPVALELAPAPAAGAARGADPFDPLLALVKRGQLLEATGWMKRARGLLESDVGPNALAAEVVVRRELTLLVAAPRSPLEDLGHGFMVVRRLRELGGLEPAPDPLADAMVRLFSDRMVLLERIAAGDAAAGERAFDPTADVVALEALCDSGLLPSDRSCGDRALDAALVVWSLGQRLTATQYQRVLVVMVRLDVDLQREHVIRIEPVPPSVAHGVWADFVNQRIKGETLYRDAERQRVPLELLALVEGPRGAALGPVTRARGLWQGAAGVNDPEAALKLLDRASELDPDTPWPALQKASFHMEWRRYGEAARWADEAITRLQRDDHDQRPSLILFETFLIYRVCVRAFIQAGDLTRARDLIARLESFHRRVKYDKLDELKAELADALGRAPAAARRPGDF